MDAEQRAALQGLYHPRADAPIAQHIECLQCTHIVPHHKVEAAIENASPACSNSDSSSVPHASSNQAKTQAEMSLSTGGRTTVTNFFNRLSKTLATKAHEQMNGSGFNATKKSFPQIPGEGLRNGRLLATQEAFARLPRSRATSITGSVISVSTNGEGSSRIPLPPADQITLQVPAQTRRPGPRLYAHSFPSNRSSLERPNTPQAQYNVPGSHENVSAIAQQSRQPSTMQSMAVIQSNAISSSDIQPSAPMILISSSHECVGRSV